MQSAIPTLDEAARLAKLRSYSVLDTGPESAFDEITTLATELVGVPIALVSLVDKDRQWFKSATGLDATETPRDVSFCGHAIQGLDPFVVSDARSDPRFSDNPLVTAGPHVTFYAGVPLVTPEGHCVGTLCVIDQQPRELDPASLNTLRRLARVVVTLLEQRTTVEALEARTEDLERFAYRLSHDLRGPLVTAGRLTEIIEEDLGAGDVEEARENLARVQGETQRLGRVVEGLLGLVEAQLAPQESSPLDLDAITGQVLDVARPADPSVQIDASFEVEGPVRLPDYRIRQILMNLVGNAVKYRRPGLAARIGVEWSTRGSGGDRWLTLRVRDNGLGIPAEALGRLTEPFTRFHPGHAEGSGLGLAIVRQHVGALGGALRIESETGQGSMFEVELPLCA